MSAVGQVTLDGEPVEEGDIIGAFVGDECRALQPVKNDINQSFVSLVMNGEVEESLVFKLWKNGKVYISTFQTPLKPGICKENLLPLEFFSTVTSVDHLKQQLSFQVTPNPVSQKLTIQFNLPKDSDVALQVLNLNGQLVKNIISDRLSQGQQSYEWYAMQYPAGAYFIQLKTSAGIITERILVVN